MKFVLKLKKVIAVLKKIDEVKEKLNGDEEAEEEEDE